MGLEEQMPKQIESSCVEGLPFQGCRKNQVQPQYYEHISKFQITENVGISMIGWPLLK